MLSKPHESKVEFTDEETTKIESWKHCQVNVTFILRNLEMILHVQSDIYETKLTKF